MWFLLIVSIINSAFDQKGVILKHRVNVAGLPINILDAVTMIGLLGVLIAPVFKRKQRADARHPLLPVLLILFAIGTLGGVLGWFRNNAPVYGFSSDFRNFTTFGMAILLGHHYLKSPTSARRFSYLHVLAGILSGGLILLFFIGTGSEQSATGAVDSIRATQYVSNYAGLAAALLFFTLLDRKCRIFPLAVTVVIMSFCFVGQFATLSRSDWIAAAAAVVSVLFLLPKEGRMGKIVGFTLAVPLLIAALLIGVTLASAAIGRDISDRMSRRVLTLLPGARGVDSITKHKAWDTRLPGLLRELELWGESPIIGNGFGYTSALEGSESSNIAFGHNAWTAALATTGILGFAAYAVAIVGTMVVARRMVRQSVDKGSVLMGAIGFTSGAYWIILGAATMSFNTQRQGLLCGLLCGLVIKARQMQLTTIREYAGYVDFDSPDMEYAQAFVDPADADAYAYENTGRFA